MGKRAIAVTSDNSSSSIGRDNAAPQILTRSHVVIVADLLEAPDKQSKLFRYSVQVGNSQGWAGGPVTRTVPHEKSLDGLFKLLVQPGVYPRGKALPLCQIDGRTFELKVD